MRIKVIYHSITGNTKKIAEAIATEVGVEAESVSCELCDEEVDLLFYGDGNYASVIHGKTKEFIQSLQFRNIKNIATFGTYGGMDNSLPKLRLFAKKCGLNVMDESFSCKGKAWGLLNRTRPDERDIENARKYARNIINKCMNNVNE